MIEPIPSEIQEEEARQLRLQLQKLILPIVATQRDGTVSCVRHWLSDCGQWSACSYGDRCTCCGPPSKNREPIFAAPSFHPRVLSATGIDTSLVEVGDRITPIGYSEMNTSAVRQGDNSELIFGANWEGPIGKITAVCVPVEVEPITNITPSFWT